MKNEQDDADIKYLVKAKENEIRSAYNDMILSQDRFDERIADYDTRIEKLQKQRTRELDNRATAEHRHRQHKLELVELTKRELKQKNRNKINKLLLLKSQLDEAGVSVKDLLGTKKDS